MSSLLPRSFIVTRVFLRKSEVRRILSHGLGISRNSASISVVVPVKSSVVRSNQLRRCKLPLLVPPSPSSQCCHSFRGYSSQDVFQGEKPKAGLPERIVESAPASLQPYLRLSRMHRPIGTWLLFWPCTWGLALGSAGMPPVDMLALFGLGAFIMRGAGCTINDMWDRHIDAKVKRTRDRPLACGELRMRHATGWLATQLSAALAILCHLNPPCFIIGVGSLGLVVLYPLAKRVTNWPQAVLGLTFNTGVIMGYTAAQSSQLDYFSMPWLDPACLAFYLSGVSWTLIYDTIYAHQDKEDDTLLGLGSTARKFGDKTKYWLTGFSCCMVTTLTLAGVVSDLSWPYYLGVAATASHLSWQILTLNINDVKNCADRFTANRHIGWILFLGLLGSYLLKNKQDLPKAPISAGIVPKTKDQLLA